MRLSDETVVNAPADRVWEVIGRQFEHIDEWASSIASSGPNPDAACSIEAPVTGRVCETGLKRFPRIEETIVAFDDEGRTLTYSATGLPSFIRSAVNQWSVTAVDDHTSKVRFDASFEVKGAGRLLVLPMKLQMRSQARQGLDDLRHFAETGQPSARKRRRLERQRASSP